MKTCMVVDDGPLDREMLRHAASGLKFLVSEASSGEEAVANCKLQLPDFMLLDWEMGNMNGMDVLKAIRSMKDGGDTCILLCTSNAHPSFVGHAFTQGADGYLVKPVTIEKLKLKLEELSA